MEYYWYVNQWRLVILLAYVVWSGVCQEIHVRNLSLSGRGSDEILIICFYHALSIQYCIINAFHILLFERHLSHLFFGSFCIILHSLYCCGVKCACR